MKTQTLLISNFKYNPKNSANDILQIDKFQNVNLNNGIVSSELQFGDIFKSFLNDENYETFKENNTEIISTITKIIPYEFFNETTNTLSTRIFAIANNFSLFELDFENEKFNLIQNFSSKPKTLFYKSTLHVYEHNNCIIFNENNTTQLEDFPNIKCFTQFKKNILFVTEEKPYTIYISEANDLISLTGNFEQFDYIDIDFENGEICKIINLKNKIYIISSYSILKYDEDENSFALVNNLRLNVYPNTVEMVDDNIIFYTSNGLYKFDGNDIEMLSNNFLIIHKNAKSVCFNQKYYILASNIENFVFEFDFENNYFIPIKFYNIKDIYAISTSKLYNFCLCNYNKENYNNITLYNNSLPNFGSQKIIFKPTLFGSTKTKQIKNLFIKAEGNFKLNIKTNVTQTCVEVYDNSIFCNLAINGSIFEIDISSENYFKLYSIFIEYCEVGD